MKGYKNELIDNVKVKGYNNELINNVKVKGYKNGWGYEL